MELTLALTKRLYWLHDAIEKTFVANGVAPLTRAQGFVIVAIAGGEHRAINIARDLGVSRQAVSQILAELEKRGVVSLEDDPTDGRSRIVKFRAEFEDSGATCALLFDALEREIGRRIGKRRLWNLHDALDAEWGEAPTIHPADLVKPPLVA